MRKADNFMHSHSALERDLKFPKSYVLVDEEFSPIFVEEGVFVAPVTICGVSYVKVPIMAFIKLGGVFKNFAS